MRHETCLICRLAGNDEPQQHAVTVTAETLGGAMHHHHLIECTACETWWFADVVASGGRMREARRDTGPCPCDENLPQFPRCTVTVPVPEDQCSCSKASLDRAVTLRLTMP